MGLPLSYLPKFTDLVPALKAVRPTIFVAVPRVYEKIRQGVEGKSAGSALKSKILKWGVGRGRKASGGDRWLASSRAGWPGCSRRKLVYGKIREAFGGRVKTFVSGGAPLGLDNARWFADMGDSSVSRGTD